jgi:hypothetical protein
MYMVSLLAYVFAQFHYHRVNVITQSRTPSETRSMLADAISHAYAHLHQTEELQIECSFVCLTVGILLTTKGLKDN